MSLCVLEFPGRPVYHYGPVEPPLAPLCGGYRQYAPVFARYLVDRPSEGRRLCKQCFREARFRKIPLPPMTEWERAQWAGPVEQERTS